MKCPRDGIDLVPGMYKGIEIDRCPEDSGMWLDYPELDQLEDTVLDQDHLKGTLMYSPHPAGINCPECGEEMTAFYYRANSMVLDVCGKHGHGFWLDGGEDKELVEFMKQRIKDLKRSQSAEAQWSAFVESAKRRGGGGFMGKVKRFLGGR